MNKRFWLIGGLLAMALLLLWTLTPPQKTGTGAKEKVWRGWPGLAAARPYALAQDFLRDRAATSLRRMWMSCYWKTATRRCQKNSKRACTTGWKQAASCCWKADIRWARFLT